MVQIAGKYAFVSQENFEDYLKAIGIGTIKLNLIALTKPDITVEADGDHYTFTTHTTLKTITISFTLGQEYEADPGTDKTSKYITTLDGHTLLTKEVDDESAYVTREFNDDGLVMTLHAKGVTAVRTFKRA